MRYRWSSVDLVQLAQTIWGDILVAIIQRQTLGHFGIVRLKPTIGSWRAGFVTGAFREVGRMIGKVMGEVDSRFDEVDVLADIISH
jgi:hypothetical protein